MKKEANNSFNNGLIMDFDSIVTPSNSLCNALNATIITNNGSENALQNDMGNGRVETAYLPEGFVPVGTTELGGIIYIVSYNPLSDKCLIGSFPSPERNISLSEINEIDKTNLNTVLSDSDFKDNNYIKSNIIKKEIGNYIIHPGDKFIVYADNLDNNIDKISNISDLKHLLNVKNVNLKLATINNSGLLIYLNDLIKYNISLGNKSTFLYIQLGQAGLDIKLDDYRDLINSTYNVFSERVSGKLYIVAELESLDKMNIGYKVVKKNNSSEITSEINYETIFNIEIKSRLRVNYIILTTYKDLIGTKEYYKVSEKEITDEFWKDGFLFLKLTISKLIQFKASIFKKDYNIKFEFTPCLNYGILNKSTINLNIDYSLINSNTIISDVWRYYKNTDSMLLNYNLNFYLEENDEIESINLEFFQYYDLDKPFFNKIINDRKLYSGTYTTIIPFSDKTLYKNSLYLVKIYPNIKNKLSNLCIYRCLYTNGCFNNEYLDANNIDFDNLKVLLKNKISFLLENGTIKDETSYSTNKLYKDLSDSSNFKDSISRSIFKTFKINTEASLEDSYNGTFIPFNLNINPKSGSYKISFNKPDLNLNTTDGSIISQTFNSEHETIKECTTEEEFNSELEHNKFNNNLIYSKCIFNENYSNIYFKTNLIDKIIANSIKKQSPVKNYFRPIILNYSDFNKYGLKIESHKNINHVFFKNLDDFTEVQNHWNSNLSKFVALSLSNGGRDNQGGGGIYHVNGTIELIKSGEYFNLISSPDNYEKDSSGNNKIYSSLLELKNCIVEGGSGKPGFPGYSIFPNNNYSEYLSRIEQNNPIILAILVNSGTNHFEMNSDKKYLLYSQSADGTQNVNRSTLFQTKLPSEYRYFQIFIKTDNQNFNEYVPLNCLFKIENIGNTNTDSCLSFIIKENAIMCEVDSSEKNNNKINDITFAQYIYSLLSLLYICDKSKVFTIDKNVPNQINYYKQIQYDFDLDLKLSLSENLNQDYYFSGTGISGSSILMSNINNNFKTKSNKDFSCLKINFISDKEYNYHTTLSYVIDSYSLINKYFIANSQIPNIDSFVDFPFYVDSKIDKENIKVPDNCSEHDLCYIPNFIENNSAVGIRFVPKELKKLDSNLEIYSFGYPLFNNNKLEIKSYLLKNSIEVGNPFIISNNINYDFLIYDPRLKLLLMDHNKYKNYNKLNIRFGSNSEEDKGDFTELPNIPLFEEFTINNFLIDHSTMESGVKNYIKKL